ncbi:MAG: M23 family metallopeptidase [Candidatus Dormibacteraeota bacterium]|nr:M23 family metallopeptidase [Candidatus Dormibacteraeota bacterium]
MATVAIAVPLSAAAGTALTPHAPTTGPATLTAQAVTQNPSNLGNLWVPASAIPAPSEHVWSQLVSIEDAIGSTHTELLTDEQRIAQVTSQLKQAPQPAKVSMLSSLLQQHQTLSTQYQQTLAQEYAFFVSVAKSASLSAQMQTVLAHTPANVQQAVTYDLTVVRTQLQQDQTINTAVVENGASAADAIAQQLASSGPVTFHAPVNGVVTQPFGPSIWSMEPPITYNGVFYPHFHTGLDIAAPMGTPVGAAAAGVVLLATSSHDAAGDLVGYGNYVVIRHANGYLTLYGHLEQLLVRAGQVVQQGQVIGLLGSTGWSTGPHVHFEVRVDGVYVDPAPFIAADIRR